MVGVIRSVGVVRLVGAFWGGRVGCNGWGGLSGRGGRSVRVVLVEVFLGGQVLVMVEVVGVVVLVVWGGLGLN